MYSGLTDLGTVDGDPCSDALAVSSNGQVVGASQSAAGGCGEWTTAFLWENGGPSVDLNLLGGSSGAGVHLFAGFWVNGRGEIVAGGTPPTCAFAETCGHVYTLIPCDENHTDVEGCDYSEVDVTTEAPVRPATTATNAAKLSAAEMMMRYRSLMANRYRRFGAFPPFSGSVSRREDADNDHAYLGTQRAERASFRPRVTPHRPQHTRLQS